MKRAKSLLDLSVAVVLGCAMGGCAEYGVVHKCGWHGCAGDAQISAEVQALLDQHRELQPPNLIYVRTMDHVVYLSGQVATELQRDTADSVAMQATGVRRVVDIIGLTYAGR